MKKAKYYFDLLMKIPPKILSYPGNAPWVAIAKAELFAARSQWEEANQSFQKVFELSRKGFFQHLNIESIFRKIYIWALELQGKTKQAESK